MIYEVTRVLLKVALGGGGQFCKTICQSMIHEVIIWAHISYMKLSYEHIYHTWGYHMSTYIVWEYIICEYVSLSHAHVYNHTNRTPDMWLYEFVLDLYIWGMGRLKDHLISLFNKCLLISVGPYKAASQNLTINFESSNL